MRQRSRLLQKALCLSIVLLSSGGAHAQSDAGRPSDESVDARVAVRARFDLQRYTLPNGLRVVLNEDHSTPNVAVAVTYDVGSRNERRGNSGFAHLFEHMMFQGSRNVEKGDHFKWITRRGGRANGTTNKERTNYFATLPAAELPLALWLEADRMKSLALTRVNFENQRAVVAEEYRLRYSGKVYALGYVRLHQLVFQGYWPYEHPTIGFSEDLSDAPFGKLREFHRAYYSPNNAVLSISGDFSPDRARELVAQFFGDALPGQPPPDFELPARMPRQTSERLSVMVDQNAKTPGVYFGFRIPPAHTRAHRALELGTFVLAHGESSRLYQSLVIEKASALAVNAWVTHYRGPSAFVIRIKIAPLSNVDTAQNWLDGELKRLRLIGPDASELAKAKAQLKQHQLSSLQSNQSRAIRLGEFETYWQDANLLTDEFSAYDDITIADVRAAASEYLLNTRRSIVEVYPPKWVRDIGPAVLTQTHIVKPGESLIRIAAQYGTTAEAIAKQNGISLKKRIVVGQRLLVTGQRKPAPVVRRHKVAKGETLSGIAHKYGMGSADLARANGISAKKPIQPGQELAIPNLPKPSKAKGKRSDKTESPKPTVKIYVVRKGDTLSQIAARHGVSVATISRENRISRKKPIRPGQKLTISVPPKTKSDK